MVLEGLHWHCQLQEHQLGSGPGPVSNPHQAGSGPGSISLTLSPPIQRTEVSLEPANNGAGDIAGTMSSVTEL